MKILIVSDIHANRIALETVLQDAGKVDKVWCLGDIVGYGPEPNECVEILRSLDLLCLAGNHDWAVLDKLDLEDFNPEARRAAMWTRESLSPANFTWLIDLPERVSNQLDKFTLVHGSPQHPIWEYVSTPAVARINFEYFETEICLMGHTHVPVVYRYNNEEHISTAEPLPENKSIDLGPERMMINPGSVGQPRDGDPRSAYAVLDTDAMKVTHRRVEYNIRATQDKMEKAHLPERLIARLNYGW
jgi:predicted phosphodiesterase